MTQPPDFDGLVVESANGDRILALPIAVMESLRYASVIRFRRQGSFFSLRLDHFTDGRQGGQPIPQQSPEPGPNSPQPNRSSAPTPEYGAPPLPVHGANNPSPAPPPAQEGDPLDPANIPLRVRRGGEWTTIYVTREQYQQYEQDGRIQCTEGTDQ